MPLAGDAAFLSPAAARDLELDEGDTLTVQVGLEPVSFRVAGILPAAAYRQRAVVLDIGTAQWRLGQTGRCSESSCGSGAALHRMTCSARSPRCCRPASP